MAWNKIHSFCLDQSENFCFSGDGSGQIHILRTKDLSLVKTMRAHTGEINAMVTHKIYPWIASLGEDRLVRIWSYDETGALSLKSTIPLRGHTPINSQKKFPAIASTSQALAFHDTAPLLACRTAGGAVLEVDISINPQDHEPKIRHCFAIDEDFDIATLRYLEGRDELFAGTVHGKAYLVSNTKIVREWRFEDEAIDRFEPLNDGTYLLASDTRRVIHLDPEKDKALAIGPQFARDDFEHITRCSKTGRIFAASFDRNIYEIDPQTLHPMQVTFRAPFKNRWIKVLKEDPQSIIVQCRLGSIFKVNIENGEVLHSYNQSPPVLWTAELSHDKKVYLAGDGEFFYSGEVTNDSDAFQVRSGVKWSKKILENTNPSYTKRISTHPTRSLIALARTSGELLLHDGEKVLCKTQFSSAIRDCQFNSEGNSIFVSTEAGELISLDSNNLEIQEKFETTEPLWSLSVSPDGKWVAAAERRNQLHILKSDNFTERTSIQSVARLPKRMKWSSNKSLLFTHSNSISEFDLETSAVAPSFTNMRNTVEDFFWTHDRRYLVAQTYHRIIFLFDFKSKEMLWVTSDQMDYSKGLLLLPPTTYPYEFISFGRSGIPMHFQIYEERILSLGRISGNFEDNA